MAIEVHDLVKRYKTLTAVDGISFDVADGAAFAFLGSNGAGKSTTISCLTTLLPFNGGTVRVAGYDARTDGENVRRRIGVVFQDSLMDDGLTVRENLRFRARLMHLERDAAARRIEELSDLIELGDFADRRYGRLSGGQRRRADIARALLHDPDVLFLDEPTAGLDPASRIAVWNTVQTLRVQRGLTVFLTTHYMEETEEADGVCIIDAGRIVAQGTPTELRARHSRSILTVTSADPTALDALARARGLQPASAGEIVTIAVPDSASAQSLLAEHGSSVRDFEFRHGRMDDVFLAVTGRGADEAEAA
ncbi:ABC transporter ATP-binding protein [Microbacterium aoyamense]|uniref:ABC transporter ATP-binding protein n=1 Tax=Microbacterium aoyamense TaxID=344166 RepID=A0ABP5B6L6_9MICO|nr:ABC transporter ATP-binding protein [Microbacterium aoyamense]